MENLANQLIVVGGSAGAYEIIVKILESVPQTFNMAIVIVLHRNAKFSTKIEKNLSEKLNLPILVAQDKDKILKNHIYFAAPGYHLLIEPDFSFALDISEPVEFSRPAIDVVFESAADVYGSNLTTILLSGANSDGAKGMALASKLGAKCYVQDPQEATIAVMPQSAIDACDKTTILTNRQLIDYFYNINL